MGTEHSFAVEAAVQIAYHLTVGNLRDNGQSTEPTPTAAKADYAKYPIMESSWSECVPSTDWQ